MKGYEEITTAARDIRVRSYSETEHAVIVDGEVVATYTAWSEACEHMNRIQSHDRYVNAVIEMLEHPFWRRFR